MPPDPSGPGRARTATPWAVFQLWMDAWSLAVEAQQVVLLRSARLARGDQRARREAQRMVTEKIANGLSVAVDAAYGATRGRSPVAIAQAALRRSRRRVRANRRRLVRP